MTTLKNNQTLKEQNNPEKNYQLNMEILSSLKSLPGKVVNLQSEKIIFKNEDTNKKVIFPEEKFTTSSSISKEAFCDPFSNEVDKIHKKSYTTNSVFKPLNHYPTKKTTMNFYNFNSMMSSSDFIMPNSTFFNPLKITNSSYSKNSFYPVMNPDNNILINSFNQVNPVNQGNSINPINIINPVNNFFPTFSVIPLINEQLLKNNNFIQTKNNYFLNKKRNADNEIIINNNIKENKEKEINETGKNNRLITNNSQKTKSNIFFVKQLPKTENESFPKKHLFTTIQKSNYNYKKRKPRKKKFINILKKIKCGHEGCDAIFKTKKQLVYHHYKMSIECHNDTINFLKMIYSTKKLMIEIAKDDKKEKEKIIEKFSGLYKDTMKKISLEEHIDSLIGFNFEDEANINKKIEINKC